MIRYLAFLIVAALLAGPRTFAASSADYVRARMVADVEAIEPGQAFRLGVLFEVDELWHIYGPQEQEFGLPTTMALSLPPGFEAGPVQYPETKRFEDLGIESFGYEDEVLLFAEVRPRADLAAGQTARFEASTSWLVCKIDGQCIPGRMVLELALPVGEAVASAQAPLFEQYAAQVPAGASTAPATQAVADETPAPAVEAQSAAAPEAEDFGPNWKPFSFLADQPQQASRPLAMMLLYAFLGGMILNIMPCVLPVLSLKVLSFVRQAGEERARIFALGLVFTAGVAASFAALASLVVALQVLGQELLGWGFQFTAPRFVVIMSAVILAFSLALFGVYGIDLPGSAMQGAYGLQSKEGPAGAFFNGVLATALATPCTAPLLGPALGFAFSQPPWMIYVFFLTIGLGLAFPYLLLSANPQWLSFLPKPGGWMETFKQFMGFVLLATVVWLLWLFGKTAGGAEGVVALVAFLVGVGLAFWIIGRGFGPASNTKRRTIAAILGVIVLAGTYVWFPERHLRWLRNAQPMQTADAGVADLEGRWETFSVQRVEDLAAQGRTVFIDFTADWCVTCKVNEAAVLAHPRVQQAFEQKDVALLKADYTHQPEMMTRIIRYFGRAGVPLYLIFPAGNPQNYVVLPEALTRGAVINNLP